MFTPFLKFCLISFFIEPSICETLKLLSGRKWKKKHTIQTKYPTEALRIHLSFTEISILR